MAIRAGLIFCLGSMALGLGALSIGVAAQEAAPRIEDACKTEMTSFCAPKGDKKQNNTACLTANQAKLTPACATAIKTTRERREKLQTVCKDDAAKLCAGVQPKGGQFVSCLRGKQAELTKDCADAITALSQPAAKK